MKYEEMEQWQLDQLVHNHVVCGSEWAIFFSGEGCEWVNTKTGQSISFSKLEAIDGVKRYDKPENAWPIMIDNNIFITATRDDHEFKYMTKCLINGSGGLGWTARFTAYSDNPLRAAMICFLKMKDAENGKH